MLAAAAERFGDATWPSRTGSTRLTYAELLRGGPHASAAALVASGIEPGDRVAIWAFNSAEWVVAFLGLSMAGAVLVPINTRFKGRRGGRPPRRGAGPRHWSRSPTSSGPTTSPCCGPPTSSCPICATIVVARGDGSGGTRIVGRLHRPGHRRRPGRGRSALASDWVRTTPRTSSSPRAPPGQPKGVVMTHGRTLCVATDWVAHDGSQRRRPLPDGQPVLPHVRTEGRHPGLRGQRGHDAPRGGVRRRPDSRPGRATKA